MATVSPSSPSWSYVLQLPHDPRAPGIARATLRTVLAAHDLPHLTPTAELLASELLTNAHLHTKGPYALRLLSNDPDHLRVAVWDTDPCIPPGFREKGALAAVPPDDAEGGRGLHLVRACADSWGVSVLRELGAATGGKLLWAECGRTGANG
ncbi:ATP-binding protein [Streptomyces sp. ME02-8801-2C]|uniref:ATP-binding protein n=1 Tax=Streptomyces sp. ME02-8801-2C TaxID=3028680 RepID=UPI0029BAED52|nr:ATP-binding protein [Streptomyces sp. ME02-8801-2C]MDX3455689.1 ATP-binding protein [Streptomyces sp. ME02-8801-2C]